MITILLFVLAAVALHVGSPWLLSLTLTGLLIAAFPALIVLGIVVAVLVWAFHRFRR
jgi:hypothetical protein